MKATPPFTIWGPECSLWAAALNPLQRLDTDNQLTAEDLLSRPPRDRGRPDDARADAKEWLSEILKEGEKLKSQIDRAAPARSISKMTLRRAAADLGVRKYRKGGKTYWALRS